MNIYATEDVNRTRAPDPAFGSEMSRYGKLLARKEAPPDAGQAMKDILDRRAAPRRLLICTGPCCNSTGDAQLLLESLRAELLRARLKADIVAEASCVRRSCLGKCSGEPLAYAEPEGVWYHRLTVDGLLRILREHVLDNRTVCDLILEEDD